ncbi:hypothetical protein O6H91_20G035000 [Diphasiastrum complanatum]|uniref:Uncharacterized protein n=1 Tax=Diphasiastrum complanatum TaxID=34168 RepID=A0ACC2AQS2_DIPCM|nr:hypothetical protein O6H91_20G035000 [Diphasiastrum complanatum]
MAARAPFDEQNLQQTGFLSLVHDYTTHQSRGERYLEELRKKNVALLPQLEVAEGTLSANKLQKNQAEEQLKGLEVELAAVEVAVRARQARVHSQQEHISHARLELEKVKQEEITERELFTKSMLELNARIRNLCDLQTPLNESLVRKEPQKELTSKKDSAESKTHQDAQIQKAVEQELAQLTTLCQVEEENLKKIKTEIDDSRKQEILLNDKHQEVRSRRAELDARLKLMENISQAAKELEDLSTQNAKLEDMFGLLSAELQKLQECPKCGANNIGEVAGGEES